MKHGALQSAEKYTKAHQGKKRWYRVVTGLACVVVFCTVYALILPAITMEKGACEIPEHTHSEACYTQVTSATRTEPVCTIESLNLHQHDGTCYDSEGNLTCGYADFVVHQHDSACYDENGNRWCPLPEIETHEHTRSCYAVLEADASEVHTHTDDCYTVERGELICTESTEPAHVHTDNCYTETSALVCEGDHEHTESCYGTTRELTCGDTEEPVHQHTDQCYEQIKTLICEPPTEPAEEAEPAEPELICGEKEIILHTHEPYESPEDPGCYDDDGNLICGKIQVLEHQHTDACFETVEEPADTEALTCTLPEDEKHTHTALCYGTWELTCDMEEHTHTAECSTAEETEATEETEETTEPEEEMSGMEIDPSLPVMGTAYASGAKTRAYSVMTLDADTTGATDPVSVENYITGATLYYRTNENGEWTDVSGATDIPGDADFKLEISYGKVPIDTLLAADGKMTYTLPALFRNATANGKITSGSAEVGTITVANNTVTLAFDTTWLTQQKTETNTVISGDFFVEAEVNLSQVGKDGTGQIVIGNTTINIDFAGDIVAKYGNVDLSKTVSAISEETDGDYLTYTLTVKAGADGCPEVKVVDCFAKTQYIEEYVGVTGGSSATNDTDGPTETGGTGSTGSVYIGAAPTEENPIPDPAGENPTKPGTLVWVIGNMAANETRTLTYRVKLKAAYTGVTAKEILQNSANVYSKTYQRDSDSVTFTPRAGATMSKVASTFTPGENGGGTITYTIWVQANADNSYVLDNVKIMDALDGSLQKMNGTLAAIRQYLSYDETSFHLYKGGSYGQNGSSGLEIMEGTTPNITDRDNDDKFNASFTYYVGSLAPGESKTLTYTVNVEPGVFVAAGNKDFKINNRACIYTDDSRTDGGVWLNGHNASKTINRKVWSRKLAGGKQETASTVSMSGSVYDATGSSVTQITPPDSSFTVPAGSYKYQVAANEAGDWDMSSASMADSLGSQYMEFVGYVRVDAYTISSNAPGSGLDDAAAIANLSGRTPNQTVWVKVDRRTSFSFTPVQIGLKGTQAYLLTYYGQPTNIDGITQVVVSNRFNLSGTVGIGNIGYVLAGIGVEASVIVEGSNRFAAEKQSWYYEEPQVTTGDFANGALYWVIKVDGKVLPSGTAIKDVTNAVGGSAHYIRGTSLVGVYTGNLGKNSLADYADLDSLIASKRLTALESRNYTVAKGTYSLTLTLKTGISLEGDSLYLIVKTDPSKRPANKRDAFTYNNKLQSSSDGTNWLDHNTASKTLYGSENIFKELGRVFTYPGSGNSTTDIKPGTRQAISTDALNGAGTYVAWQIHVNYEGSLSGRYRVVEQIPVGMEVTYVRIWWLGDKYKAVLQDSKPTFVQLTAEEIAALGGSWTEHAKTLPSNNAGKQTNYYYTNGQQVIWDIVNLVAGGGYRDDYAVEIQIVCKVTDPNVLLGGVSKEFNNVVRLQNSEGTTIGNDSNGVTIKKQTLSKQGTYNPETNGGRYPFKITLNELGEDLVSDADTITLVDELSDTLILDTTSIRVVNTKTDEVVTNWTSSVEGQTLKIVLPDKLPLTVTYETTVNAAPGQTISISNNAHWEGYTTPSGGSVEVKEFRYSTGGTAGADTSPSVTVKKLDQNNTGQALPGATFTLVEGSYAGGSFTAKENGLSLTGTTGGDGTLTFGKESGQTMSYNTVYCLTETVAPKGYVLDAAPHYFAVVKKQDDGSYPTFPNGVTVWYLSADYTYQAYNHKGEATVAKKFLDAGGKPLEKIDGTYRFGIYAEANLTGDPLQTVAITYANRTVTPAGGTARFTDLPLGGTYYIYELDGSGQPISGNVPATVNSSSFLVTYTNGPAVTVPTDGSAAATVTVTNQVCYPELPHTGGAGTIPYTIGGFLLLTGAAFLLLYHHTKRRKEDSVSS